MTVGVAQLLADYRARRRRPSELAAEVGRAVAATTEPVWIHRVPLPELVERGRQLDAADPGLPLYGIPFAVKDNIDVAGLPTSAACPGFATEAPAHARAVELLLDAGAILVGKTNLDQFATGLVGTRSPYGALSSVFDPERVSGGSSSGSAVAVARGLVPFALGTDTAGSGRVPAAYNGLVGVKPTVGLISTRGVVPACASLDCVSVFATTVSDAALVVDVLAGYDPECAWSRRIAARSSPRRRRIGVPAAGAVPIEESEARGAWRAVRERLTDTWETVEVDVEPLLECAGLLYGAWIAERALDLAAAVAAQPPGLDPTVAALIEGGSRLSGVEVFAARHRLADLARAAQAIWDDVEALVLPTAPRHPTHREVRDDPVGVNERLGRLTNFANLMDLAAVAVPGAMREDGLPFGVTLFAPAGSDRRLLELGAEWLGEPLGRALDHEGVELAVVGAHMSGLPLNAQLTQRGAVFARRTVTAARYRLYALDGGDPPRPGLIRAIRDGAPIEVEVWRLPPATIGSLLGEIPPPLALGRVELADGSWVMGFVCEGYAAAAATDITRFGGWRDYLASLAVLAP